MKNEADLPNLPAQRKKREASITPRVLRWFSQNYPKSCALEIKATNNFTISPSALLPHQRAALLSAASMGGIAHKIADTGRRLPFDAFVLKGAPALVVACFTRFGVCYAVPVNEWKGAKYGKPDKNALVFHI